MDTFSELLKSIIESFKTRVSNPLYGTFIVTWILVNWNFVYSFLFLDQNIIFQESGMLKNEYLSSYFFDEVTILCKIFDFAITPIILTVLIIWVLPKYIFLPAIKEDAKYEIERNRLRLEKERDLRELRVEIERKKADELKAVAEQKQSEKIIQETNPLVPWEEEYQQLKNKTIFSYFKTLYQIIYENNGEIYGQQHYKLAMPLIAYLDSSEALVIERGIIELRDKGNFFMKRYLEENS
jgi:hypothetical protein